MKTALKHAMHTASPLPDMGISFTAASNQSAESGVRCRFHPQSNDGAWKAVPVSYLTIRPDLRLVAPLRTSPASDPAPASARAALLLIPLVVAVHFLAAWLGSTASAPSIAEPDRQTVVIHTGLAADPAIAAAAAASARAAEAQRQQAAEQQKQAVAEQAARQQAQLEASRLAEQADIQARQKPPRQPSKPAPHPAPTAPAKASAQAPASSNTAPAATEAKPAPSAPGPATDVAATAGKQYLPLTKAAPDYPASALENELEGDCTVEYDLMPDGTTTAARLVKGQCDASHFGAASLKAAAGFRYSPQVADGHPVKVIGVRNTFRYRLQNAQ
ncbi:energy transducer TonB [Pseudomonas viridiflava]|uniref:energy transducer TonB n=1 Tax=Pseudomonas viridiflava TaxID=33069 RepID=UPI0018E5D329|nr:energy transducer TonB [Pseudomonas viridiflava]MBI6701707.1 TonB family protein [Pseudomonas viridiflava]MBI6726011.1 TonB family protein [Pseudomonas viridiflava]